MNSIRMKGLLLVGAAVLLFTINGLAESNKYSYDPADPSSVVQAACKMIMNADYNEMVSITELAEKKRTLDTVEQMKDSNISDKVKKESEKISSFELLRLELYTNDTNKMAVVFTKWLIKIQNNQPKNDPNFVRMNESNDPSAARRRKTESDVYVDYLLKNYDGKWKIVSKKTR